MKDCLSPELQERLKTDEPLLRHVNFRIGGPADLFIEVKSVDELKEVIHCAKKSNTPFAILGGGSNTLPFDEGYRGLVIKLAMRSVEINGTEVIADAGVLSIALARKTAQEGLKGFTWAIGLPGTIGGAVRGNAGCFGGDMSESVESVEVLRDGEVITLTNADLKFGYRDSLIKHNNDIVLRAHLRLEEGDNAALLEELKTITESRKAKQPLYAGSAGCIFKNYEAPLEEIERLAETLPLTDDMKASGRISTGFIVDQLGLKGKRIGDAEISKEHGNFLVNHGKATASDIVQLIALVKTKARNELGIQLEEEIRYLG
jgi:UDP-N-acetylmuramate dehydrogenase